MNKEIMKELALHTFVESMNLIRDFSEYENGCELKEKERAMINHLSGLFYDMKNNLEELLKYYLHENLDNIK